MDLYSITDALLNELRPLRFGPPVTHVYNPLEYARKSYDRYLELYSSRPKEIVLLGMNPGPWGMAQTGVPFGEVTTVKEWLRIQAPVGTPAEIHPKRPVRGFACPKSEVSGRRLWGWRTPNNLRIAERKPLLEACDRALRRTIQWFRPRYVVGVGRFAGERAHAALTGLEVRIGNISHPSPANPKANRGWDSLVMKELRDLGIRV
ncbi:MAG: single-stranded DNA-binding protein [Deltaproteobacteria bacterium]|nr:single-stranded DNA-binding protein [Deltaproteobacteria bacterium]